MRYKNTLGLYRYRVPASEGTADRRDGAASPDRLGQTLSLCDRLLSAAGPPRAGPDRPSLCAGSLARRWLLNYEPRERPRGRRGDGEHLRACGGDAEFRL